ncbi:MAG: DUF4169 family protein [Pseudomonadota bacterium]
MAKVINLKTARKRRARTQKAAHADARAALFGRGKAQKQAEIREAEAARRHLENHRRDGEDDA